MEFFFLECRDDNCRFRFPASAAEAVRLRCPRCGGPLRTATMAHRGVSAGAAPVFGPDTVALLDNIRSIHNVGSMFRTADGAGIARLHLAGITATPDHPNLAKAALGAHETVDWVYHPNGVDAAAHLKVGGFTLWALERNRAGLPEASLFDIAPPVGPLALVVGNEKAGIDPAILELCERVCSLPMRGQKSSLNVAVAFGIAAYHVRFARPALSWSVREVNHG